MSEIAILVATYNGEKYIRELIDSIFNQTYSNYICYFHDDGSTDGTINIIKEYKRQNPNKVVILEYAPTGSAKANFMSMLKYVNEEYIMFADQDDIWMPEKIEVSLQKIKQIEYLHITPALIFSDLRVVDKNLNVLDESFMNRMNLNPNRLKVQQLMAENVGAGCTIMINHLLKDYVLKLKDINHIRMHDAWIMVVAAVFGRIEYINKPTILYRQHEMNVSGSRVESLYDKIARNIQLIIKRENRKVRNTWLRGIDAMAIELLQMEDLPREMRLLFTELINIHNKSKLQRINFYFKNDFLRNTNKFWMLLWV